jgi:hypothetical protein
MNNGADGAPPNHHRPRSAGSRLAGPRSVSHSGVATRETSGCLWQAVAAAMSKGRSVADMELRSRD